MSKNCHPLYGIWQQMNNRCRNPDNPAYKHYGGRGITICDRWRGSGSQGCYGTGFDSFIEDLAPTWFPGAWIERIDNDKGYSPDNCRWATPLEQGRNKRSNTRLDYEGCRLCLSEVAQRTGVSEKLLGWRLRKGWTASALFRPANAVSLDTELGPMTMREAVWYYEINRSTLARRFRLGKTWRDGLFDPVKT